MLSLSTISINSGDGARRYFARNTNTKSRGVYHPKADDFVGSFFAILNRWRSETRFLSDSSEIADHPSFKALVENAEKVIPLIKMELSREPSLLIWVLEDHFGMNPYTPGDEGNVAKQSDRWLTFLNGVE